MGNRVQGMLDEWVLLSRTCAVQRSSHVPESSFNTSSSLVGQVASSCGIWSRMVSVNSRDVAAFVGVFDKEPSNSCLMDVAEKASAQEMEATKRIVQTQEARKVRIVCRCSSIVIGGVVVVAMATTVFSVLFRSVPLDRILQQLFPISGLTIARSQQRPRRMAVEFLFFPLSRWFVHRPESWVG